MNFDKAPGANSADGGWIGVDLDGTLAEYNGWKSFEDIGKVVPRMKARVLNWLANGYEVKIFTARACEDPKEAQRVVGDWLVANGMPYLEVTNIKDYRMWALWDDRAVGVFPNTGQPTSAFIFEGSPPH